MAISATILLFKPSIILPQRFTIITFENQQCKLSKSTFSLQWIHSVDKTPWREDYERHDQGFILTHSIFKTFGAGVPHDGIVIQSNDGMIHYQMNLEIPEINWVIDQEVFSTIILPDNRYWEVYKNAPRYSEINIRNHPLYFWQLLSIRNCYEP